ncbi:MAG: DUF4337 family protein [Opitutaceae bacterium]|nr:DUF4337 family protein [Opitutaceae bacterium]
MKIAIPDSLKAEVPQTLWGKILTATPIILTVLSTMLAGLSSSEMTRAQYDRALGAQLQSKAGDQWGYFQAKRLRGSLQRSTLDLLESAAPLGVFDPARLPATAEVRTLLESDAGRQLTAHLHEGTVPAPPATASLPPPVQAVLDAIDASQPEPAIAILLNKVSDDMLDNALRDARLHAAAVDASTAPVNLALDRLVGLLATSADATGAVRRDFIAARLRYTAQRYDGEARANQIVANLLELQVRKNNFSANRHHARSQRFFYGMLAAQAAVIISTFAIAARQRNLLWSLAAAAGLVAVSVATYVYLFV